MELLISICLMASPADCRNEHMAMSETYQAPMACMMTAQQAIAQWQEQHPKWRVERWKCVPPGRLATAT